MLTIYAPYNNQKSKAWEVFNGVKKTWPEQVVMANNEQATAALPNAMFWGFVNTNRALVHKSEEHEHDYEDASHMGMVGYYRIYFANGGDRTTDNVPEMKVCEQLGVEMIWGIGGGKIQSSSWLTGGKRDFI